MARRPRTERTTQGDQFILPGAERKTAPGLPYAVEPNGQLALGFFEPPTDSEKLQAKIDAPLRPRCHQLGEHGLALFKPNSDAG